MSKGYLNKDGEILFGRLAGELERGWVWAIIAEARKRFPQADHWTTGGPDKGYIDIRIGKKEKGKKRGNPVFCFRRDASLFVHRGEERAGKYDPLTIQSAATPEAIARWFDRHRIAGPEQESLQGSGFVPSDYTESELAVDQDDAEPEATSAADSGPLNRILYGPPGTGKTFRTVEEALKIIERTNQPAGDDDARKLRFDALRRAGRIEFVTFHQSYSYEDFIEGIRAESVNGALDYRVRDGILKRMAIAAMYPEPVETSAEPGFADVYRAFLREVGAGLPYSLTSQKGKSLSIQAITAQGTLKVTHDPHTILHPVGRGRMEKLYQAYPTLAALEKKGVNEAIVDVIGGANVTVYWAALKRLLSFKAENWDDLTSAAAERLDESEIDYDEMKQRVLGEDVLLPNGKPYVLVIDEINRGNMSRVFGELITLIESSKRAGKKDVIDVKLPYSGERFSVPSNLYIIGTMNTADRSLAVVDTALRRRFDFIEMMPDTSRLKVRHVAGVDIAAMLEAINLRIEYLYDREHAIGHAFFMGLTSSSTISDLAAIFRNNILPLLEEYFYEDWEKIARILSKSGIYELQPAIDLGFPHSAKVYRRNLAKLDSPASYQAIYGQHGGATAATAASTDA